MRKALFLDRDGVINHDPGDYTYSLDEFVILPTVMEALQLAVSKGFELVVVTNQAGISRGLYIKEEVDRIHAFFQSECKKNNVEILEFFYSIHHPDICNSLSRKPAGLWVERACAKYKFDKDASVMIGDRDRDVLCANAAGVRGIQMKQNGDLLEYVKTL
jgi:D-glycero-D-manno-heptose 1,7-bisphosphate phosphatase